MKSNLSKWVVFRNTAIFLILLAGSENMLAQKKSAKVVDALQADTVLRYNDSRTGELFVLYPKKAIKENNPAVLFYFGGGWNSGNPKQFEAQAHYLNSLVFTAVLANYRTKNNSGTTPKESLMDAKSAMRYLKKHAAAIHVNPDEIMASGGSAGGHLAAATAFCDNINNETDDLTISTVPSALILFNPVIDNGPGGYGYDRVKEYYKDFSPLHNIKKNAPPTIFFLGTEDALIPLKTARNFKKKYEKVGAHCDLMLYPGEKHGFFNSKNEKNFKKTMKETVEFLRSLGYQL